MLDTLQGYKLRKCNLKNRVKYVIINLAISVVSYFSSLGRLQYSKKLFLGGNGPLNCEEKEFQIEETFGTHKEEIPCGDLRVIQSYMALRRSREYFSTKHRLDVRL